MAGQDRGDGYNVQYGGGAGGGKSAAQAMDHWGNKATDANSIWQKKVCIVGGAAQEKYLPGWGATDWEHWGLNAIRPEWFPNHRWSRWFNLHRYEHLKRDWPEGIEREVKWAWENQEIPFYVLDEWTDCPNTAPLPNRILFPRNLGFSRNDYHAGSFDMLVAFAVRLGFTQIQLNGVKLDDPFAEPISARACLEYWCGFAEGRGVAVEAAPDCELLAQYHLVKSQTTYGWDDIKLVEPR